MTILKQFIIQGHSMMPYYQPGDTIFVTGLFYVLKSPKIGDVIVFKKENNYIVKRIIRIKNNTYLVNGDNKEDSTSFGYIQKRAIIGKVIAHI